MYAQTAILPVCEICHNRYQKKKKKKEMGILEATREYVS